MLYFPTKNPSLGKFWKVLKWKMLEYFMNIRPTLQPVDIFYDHMVHFVAIGYRFLRFGMLHQEKSGNPALETMDPAPLHRDRLGNHLVHRFYLKNLVCLLA
jgi:hypothetical protein